MCSNHTAYVYDPNNTHIRVYNSTSRLTICHNVEKDVFDRMMMSVVTTLSDMLSNNGYCIRATYSVVNQRYWLYIESWPTPLHHNYLSTVRDRLDKALHSVP